MIAGVARPDANWAADHPEWWAMACSAAAWIVMLTAGPDRHGWLCLAPNAGFGDNIRIAWETGTLTSHLCGWITMTIAMIPPLTIPLIRHVAVRSFAARRHRAIATFLAGIIGIWLPLGMVTLVVLAGTSVTLSQIPAIALATAAGWQLTPMKRVALLRCHRTFPLGAAGWRADWDCARYGMAHGLDCVASCWPMMLAVILASHNPLIAVCIQLITMAERRGRRPQPGLSALALLLLI